MEIAILGWGSLLWEGGQEFDQWHGPWHCEDGPSLKIEFSRVSLTREGALTIVIDPIHGVPSTVAWCLSKRDEPNDAIRDLMTREGTGPNGVGRVFLGPGQSHCRDQESHDGIEAWAKAHNLDVVIWTDLESNFEPIAGRGQFSVSAAVSYLKTLPASGRAKAAEYVSQAPHFVRTPVRAAVQAEAWYFDALVPGADKA
jgi:hypothetical protein